MLIDRIVAYSPRTAVRLRLRLAGARVVASPTADTTHAVLPVSSLIDGTCASLRYKLTALRVDAAAGSGSGVNVHFVSEAWLDDCEACGCRADEKKFALREARA